MALKPIIGMYLIPSILWSKHQYWDYVTFSEKYKGEKEI
jgi:hypothetical protein